MSNEFMREDRYIVFKVSDLGNSLKGDEIHRLAQEYAEQRRLKGKEPLECVVVEKDWPEYESTRLAIEARVTGVQPAPIEQDTSVRKAWARFSNELHRSPDAPYPGMSEAFEQHFSQSFIDREWRAEAATWAAAWKAAKRHGAQPTPSVPDGFAWPECPKRRQSHVLFDDGYEEGWAACVATIKAALAAPEAKP